jgi:hypothetical protein
VALAAAALLLFRRRRQKANDVIEDKDEYDPHRYAVSPFNLPLAFTDSNNNSSAADHNNGNGNGSIGGATRQPSNGYSAVPRNESPLLPPMMMSNNLHSFGAHGGSAGGASYPPSSLGVPEVDTVSRSGTLSNSGSLAASSSSSSVSSSAPLHPPMQQQEQAAWSSSSPPPSSSGTFGVRPPLPTPTTTAGVSAPAVFNPPVVGPDGKAREAASSSTNPGATMMTGRETGQQGTFYEQETDADNNRAPPAYRFDR